MNVLVSHKIYWLTVPSGLVLSRLLGLASKSEYCSVLFTIESDFVKIVLPICECLYSLFYRRELNLKCKAQ